MKNIKIGDIVEVYTDNGLAYLHYVYNDKTVGCLVRVLPGLYSKTPSNIVELAVSNERYWVYYPVSAAFKQKLVKVVGFYPADQYKKPKYMRSKHIIKGEFIGWHIIDTETWQRDLVKSISPSQKLLSPWGVWNHTLLVERLVTNWNLKDWE